MFHLCIHVFINYWKFATIYVAGDINSYKIIKPGEVYSHSYSGLVFDEKSKLDNYISFRDSNLYNFIYKNEKPFYNLNTKNFYNKFPALDFSKKWSNNEVNSYFKLSKEETAILIHG